MNSQLLLSLLLGCITPVALQAAAPATAARAAAFTAAERAEVVETMATAAERRYVDADGGAKIASRLRQRLAEGAYESLVSADELAKALTRDMREVVPDSHLRAVHEPGRAERGQIRRMVPPGAPGPAPYARIDSRSTEQIAATNFGFARAERFAGNIGYLKLTRLVPLQLSRDAALKAMASLRGSEAVIIDLRGVPGGSPDLVVQLVSHFAGAQPVRLMTTYNRALGETEELWTVPDVPGGRLTGVPLYILQDKNSASAAEMLSYFVQRQKLGMVIGETSAGAGNGGNMIPVGSDISFFLPQMRIVDGPGWEGTGVKPDVEVPADKALDEALKRARLTPEVLASLE